MANKQTYQKGDQVWVQYPENTSEKRPALILSIAQILRPFNNELYFTIRYLDTQGSDILYQCIPESRIKGYITEE